MFVLCSYSTLHNVLPQASLFMLGGASPTHFILGFSVLQSCCIVERLVVVFGPQVTSSALPPLLHLLLDEQMDTPNIDVEMYHIHGIQTQYKFFLMKLQ